MNKFENPIQFNTSKSFNDVEVSYSNLMEISQGGPEIGTISINRKPVQFHRFGGPCLHKNKFVYAPVFVRKFLGSGFKLSKINILTLDVKIFGKTKDLIFLDKIEDNWIYFFEDLDKRILRRISEV